MGKATQFQYTALYKPNQLIYGSGQTAVITGWTVKQAIAKHLEPDEFAVIGQLYSPTRGINLLIRNLLFNPHVRFLVVLNATREDKNAGAGTCLLDFFRNGFEEGFCDTGRICWRIHSKIPGYIDIEIPANVLQKLQESIDIKEAKSIAEACNFVKTFAKQEPLAPWGEAKNYPISKAEPIILPGQRYGHRIEGKTIAETWIKIIHRIKTTGTIRPTGYDGKWQELIDLMTIVTEEPEAFYFPEPNYLPIDRSFLHNYISQMKDDSLPEEGVKYTYGQRLRSHFEQDQIEQVINKLIADIDSARAVMSLWDVNKDGNDSPPCLNHIWIRIVENELSLTATFRSNDMFSAWPANAMGLRALQQHIRDEIVQRSAHKLKLRLRSALTSSELVPSGAEVAEMLKMGPLITISQSAHIYDDCWENAEKVIQSQYYKIYQQRDYADPAGSFVITVQNNEILVEHTTPGSGEIVNCYSSKSAKKLYQQIAANCPGLQVEHAMYLGTELQKAEIALSSKQNLIYEQDRQLKTTLF